MNRRSCRYYLLATAFVSFSVATANAGTYYSDDNFDVIGIGNTSQRSCVVALHPTQQLGVIFWPQLQLAMIDEESTGISLKDTGSFADVTFLQGNRRQPFAPATNLSLDAFRASDIGQAILSKRLFFITAKLAASSQDNYVSSRYDPVDFDRVLRIVEAHCRFDAEALLSDTSDRQNTEQNLDLPQPKLTLMRWVLRKKYGHDDRRPGDSLTLSALERDYLKRYTADSMLPISRYLNEAVVQRLLSDAAALDLKIFTQFQKRDLGGGDYDVARETNLDACARRCQTEDLCRAYTFDRWNRMCFLKTTSTGALRLEPRSVTGVTSTIGTTDFVGDAIIEKRRRKAFPDPPYSRVSAAAFDECAAMCLSEARCGGFNFQASSGRCSLIDWPSEYTDSASNDLGFKIQPPP